MLIVTSFVFTANHPYYTNYTTVVKQLHMHQDELLFISFVQTVI